MKWAQSVQNHHFIHNTGLPGTNVICVSIHPNQRNLWGFLWDEGGIPLKGMERQSAFNQTFIFHQLLLHTYKKGK